MNTMYIGYIYKFTLIPTGKIYIGKRQKPEFDNKYWGSGTTWKKVISNFKKEDIKREILEWCTSIDDLNTKEVYWISKLNSRDPSIGYNQSIGGSNGSSGVPCSLSRKNKVSRANKGRKHSEISKKNMSEGQKRLRRENPEYNKKCISYLKSFHLNNPESYKTRCLKIRCIELDMEFNSIKEACEYLGLTYHEKLRISYCFKNNDYTVGGYHWELISGTVKNSYNGKKVMCIETKEIFNSITEASIKNNNSNISRACRKGCLANGYHWKFV